MPDENRPTWRPQDEYGPRARRSMSEDTDRDRERHFRDRERYETDRERYAQHWDDLPRRDFSEEPDYHYRDDPEAHYRAAERESRDRGVESYGQGQSGYGAGRYASDRALRSQSRANQYYPGPSEERSRDRGADDRYTMGRGGESWSPDDRGSWSPQEGYDEDRYAADRGSHYLGQGGQEMGPETRGREPWRPQHTMWRPEPREPWGRHGSAQPPGSHYDEQTRYGTRGYQGYRQGEHRGKGPQGYQRSDERIREAICEALTDDPHVDATSLEVTVRDGEVTLSGTVEDRYQKRAAEDAIEHVSGVRDVHNQIRIGGPRSRDLGQESSAHRTREYGDASNGQDRRHRA